jgi:UDP-N-acetylmuramate dehydrogenase
MASRASAPEIAGLKVEEDVNLTPLNALGIAARARWLVEAHTEAALAAWTRWARESSPDPASEAPASDGLPFIVLGGGSNVVFSRDYYETPFVRLAGDFRRIAPACRGLLRAGAGVLGAAILRCCEADGVGGLECLSGIPGTLGGAIAGNAGWGGMAIGERVEALRVMDAEGRTSRRGPVDAGFAYRRSALGGLVVLSAELRVDPMDECERLRRAEEARAARSGQPRGVRSAGCVFRNPPGDSAGRLIDAAGLKGARVGGALVSPAHANFIVNDGGATGADIMELIRLIRRTVQARMDVSLDIEVKII